MEGAAIAGWTRGVDGLSAFFTPDGGNFGHPGIRGWVTYNQGEPEDTEFTPWDDADTPPQSTERAAPVRGGDDHLS